MLKRMAREVQGTAADRQTLREAEFVERALSFAPLGAMRCQHVGGKALGLQGAYLALGAADRAAALRTATRLRRQVKDCEGRWSTTGDRMVAEAFFLRDELLDALNMIPVEEDAPAKTTHQLTL